MKTIAKTVGFHMLAAVGLTLATPAWAVYDPITPPTGGGSFADSFGNDGTSGNFSDVFSFTIQMGKAFGSVISISDDGDGDIAITSVTLDGVAGSQILSGDDEFWKFSRDLVAGAHELIVAGNWGNGGSYGGQITFRAVPVIPAVPEPAAWGMMLMGFGFVGAALRRRNRTKSLAFA